MCACSILAAETWLTSCVAVFQEFLLILCLDTGAKIAWGDSNHEMCRLKRQFAIKLDRVYLPMFAFERRWSTVLSEYIWKSYCGVYNENLVFCLCLYKVVVGNSEFICWQCRVVLNYCPEQPSECPQKLKAVTDLHWPSGLCQDAVQPFGLFLPLHKLIV